MARHPLVILAVVHILLGLVLGYSAEDGPEPFWLAVYCGLFFSQTSLVGIWGGFATNRWPIRLAGVTVGFFYLWAQFCFSIGDWDIEQFILVFLSTFTVATVFLFVRRFSARLESPSGTPITNTAEGLQFSIRHLMLLTFVIACLLAVGRWLQPFVQGAGHLAFIIAISLCFIAVGVTSAWTMLGKSHLISRSLVVLGIAFSMAFVPAYFMGRGDYWVWGTIMVVQALCLLGSLFVVRRCGFRLVRIAWNQ